MARMTEDELKAITDAEMRNSVGYAGGKLSLMRQKAEWYYLALPKGDLAPPEVDGRSSVVVPYVRNVVESMLPQLMLKFAGGDSVVEFEPQKSGDEQKAETCTDYLNYLFWKKNSGHSVAYTWMKDALLQKRGIIKVWWDTRVEQTKEEYKGLSQVELAQILDDEEVEATEQKSYPSEEDAEQRQEAIQHLTQQMQNMGQVVAAAHPPAVHHTQMLQQQIAQINAQPPVLLYDITAKRSKKGGKICIENVPPEEFLISRKAKDIATSPFVGQRFLRTLSDLKSMGYKNVDMLGSDDQSVSLNAERIERLSWDDELAANGDQEGSSADESQRMVWVTECYIRCDWDGDGISELRKVTRAGNEILDNEEVDVCPFVSICPIPLPHKFFGLSIADLAMETQKTETSILRSQLDNMYLQVNGRYFAVDGQVNLDDLLTSRPGGVVRIKAPGMVGRLDQAMGDASAGMGMLEYMQQFGESATGWTRYSQGNDAKAIQGTATGANIITNKDDMRLDLVARNFAEGWVELFRQMLKLVCQHQDKNQEIRLNGNWVDIDPREWRNQFDININVGLGVGNKDQQVQHLMAVIQQQEKVHAIGVASPENIYNASAELAKLIGQKSGDKFFTDPAKAPPQQPKPDPEMIKGQMAMQLAQANGQVTMQVEQAKLQAQAQLETQKMQLQAQVDDNAQRAQQEQNTQQQQLQAQVDAHKAMLEQQSEASRLQHELVLEQLRQQAETDRKERENATKVLIAQIAAQTQADGLQAAATAKADATVAGVDPHMAEVLKSLQALTTHLASPKQIVRDANGRATGIQSIQKTAVQ